MKTTFSIKNLFNSAWADYQKNWKQFILISIIFVMVGLLGNLGSHINPITGMIEQSGIVVLVTSLLQLFLWLGFVRYLLNIVDNKKAELEDIFHGANSLWHYIYFAVAYLLLTAVIGLGTVLLVIPGLIALIGFIFVCFLVAEEREGIFESFQKSWQLTHGNRWKIFGLIILLVILNVLGLLAVIVGLVITLPLSYLVVARLYRTLGGNYLGDETRENEEVLMYEETLVIETEEE